MQTLLTSPALKTAGQDPIELVKLSALMAQSAGERRVRIGLIDGPVAAGHPDLAGARLEQLASPAGGSCAGPEGAACAHGTFVAGILAARRGSGAPALCPECTLLLYPIFNDVQPGNSLPQALPEALAAAIAATVDAGARVVNVSAAVLNASANDAARLKAAVDYAAARDVIVVVAAGNQSVVGGSAIVQHPWVLSVAACDDRGYPIGDSNLGHSIGRHGLSAPGRNVKSLSSKGGLESFGGTSAAAAFVSGAAALLLSALPAARPSDVRLALLAAGGRRRVSVAPPVLDAASAFELLSMTYARSAP